MTSPLDKARQLILKLSSSQEAREKIALLQNISHEELQQVLASYFYTAQDLAFAGKVKEVSIMLRVLEYFKDTSHDRMLLHYIAQAAANKALKELQDETHPHHEDMVTALTLISEAFADADAMNDEKKID